MDTLTVATINQDANNFLVQWKWKQNGARQPNVGGTLSVALHDRFTDDRSILAELGAIYHLMCDREVQGKSRLGNGVRVQVTSGAIKKALARTTLKRTDKGNTEKPHVALFSQFLATRFFEAEVEVLPYAKWDIEELRIQADDAIVIDAPRAAALSSPIGEVIISRHGLNRFVERFAAKEAIQNGTPLDALPDARWTRAWRILEGLMLVAKPIEIPAGERDRIRRKYGPGVALLHHLDSRNLFILRREPYGWVMATTLVDSGYNALVPRLPVYAGGRLVQQR